MSTYPPTSGGTIHGYQLIRNLTLLGHEISNWYFDIGANPYVTQCRGRALLRFLKEIDVLYIRIEWKTVAPALSCLSLLKPRIPVIWEINGTPNELLLGGSSRREIQNITRYLRIFSRLCDCAICVTDEIAAYAQKELKISSVRVVPNGSDPELIPCRTNALPSARSPLRVAWVGTSRAPWHDIDTLFETAHRLQGDQDIQFVIIGDTKTLPTQPKSNVELAGSIPYQQLGSILSTCDVGIHLFKDPHKQATIYGSPLKIFDYMAAGLAIISNSPGQALDIIKRWHCGSYSDGNASDIARILRFLNSNRPVCQDYGRNGRQAVEHYYNWKRVSVETEQILKSLIDLR